MKRYVFDCKELAEIPVTLILDGRELKTIINGLTALQAMGGDGCPDCDMVIKKLSPRLERKLLSIAEPEEVDI